MRQSPYKHKDHYRPSKPPYYEDAFVIWQDLSDASEDQIQTEDEYNDWLLMQQAIKGQLKGVKL
jgi:hypothetical protein